MGTIKKVKWVITGGDGQLGHALVENLRLKNNDFKAYNRLQLDITDVKKIEKTLATEKPDIVINAAAWTNVELAEIDFIGAKRVNTDGPAILAKLTSKFGARFVHISSDYVFAGAIKNPWKVNSIMNPSSNYGITKMEGEIAVRENNPQGSYIVRTAWLYSPWGKNFALTMAKLALNSNDFVNVVNDQTGQPTSANDLSEQIYMMLKKEAPFGTYHATNSGSATWFDFAQEIFRLLGQDCNRVIPVATKEFNTLVNRPEYSVLDNSDWGKIGIKPMQNWKKSLNREIGAIRTAIETGI